MKYRLRHRSSYRYALPVDLSSHVLHLAPRHLPRQIVTESDIVADPAPAFWEIRADYFGNRVAHLSLVEPHDRFSVELVARVEVQPPAPLDPSASPPWESVRDGLREGGGTEWASIVEFTFPSLLAAPDPAITAYAAESFRPGRKLLEAALDLNGRIHRDFTFDPAATVVATPLAEVMAHRRGVCQDFAHLAVAAFRSQGLAARYVSGYIRTYRADRGPNFAGADASHAWVSIHCPGIGWVDLDPTNDLVVEDEHIVLAWGRDYDDVSPIRGVLLGGGEHKLDVAVQVTPEP
jgi:transglutaminase-like putative cysteine protease